MLFLVNCSKNQRFKLTVKFHKGLSSGLHFIFIGECMVFHCNVCCLTLPCVSCGLCQIPCVLCYIAKCVVLRYLACCVTLPCMFCYIAMCLVLHSRELCANRFSPLGLYRVLGHFLISNSLLICNVPCNFLRRG